MIDFGVGTEIRFLVSGRRIAGENSSLATKIFLKIFSASNLFWRIFRDVTTSLTIHAVGSVRDFYGTGERSVSIEPDYFLYGLHMSSKLDK